MGGGGDASGQRRSIMAVPEERERAACADGQGSFVKKTKKTPRGEIDLALQRAKEVKP
jgi:hypothetical protein